MRWEGQGQRGGSLVLPPVHPVHPVHLQKQLAGGLAQYSARDKKKKRTVRTRQGRGGWRRPEGGGEAGQRATSCCGRSFVRSSGDLPRTKNPWNLTLSTLAKNKTTSQEGLCHFNVFVFNSNLLTNLPCVVLFKPCYILKRRNVQNPVSLLFCFDVFIFSSPKLGPSSPGISLYLFSFPEQK